jgi:hypothetical protein
MTFKKFFLFLKKVGLFITFFLTKPCYADTSFTFKKFCEENSVNKNNKNKGGKNEIKK